MMIHDGQVPRSYSFPLSEPYLRREEHPTFYLFFEVVPPAIEDILKLFSVEFFMQPLNH